MTEPIFALVIGEIPKALPAFGWPHFGLTPED